MIPESHPESQGINVESDSENGESDAEINQQPPVSLPQSSPIIRHTPVHAMYFSVHPQK